MNRMISVFVVLLVPITALSAGIVNNYGQSGEDSLAITVFCTDSLGNPTSADSFFVLVTGPGGDSVFAERLTAAAMRIDSSVLGSLVLYHYGTLVPEIDGSGSPGTYQLTVMAQKNTPLFRNVFGQCFQVVDWELNEIGDSIGLAARNTNELLDSVSKVLDSLAAMPDSMPIPGSDKATLSSMVADSVLTDSTHYQGAAALFDSAQLAGWIWNTPQTNHTASGTFGSHLDASISGLSGGAGVYTITVCVQDSSTSSPIPHTSLAIRSLNQASLIAVSQTDASGCAQFSLDADSFVVVARNQGYTFAGCDTIVVTGPEYVTVAGYYFDPGIPDSPFLCRVYGYLRAIDGTAVENASIVASLPAGIMRSNHLVISPLKITTTTDSTGYFALDLLPSESLTPGDAEYEITITLPGGTILRRRFEIPNVPTWQITW